jgi:hypothetical protein
MAEESEMLAAALKEEAQLVRELEKTPLFRKLQAVREVISAYKIEKSASPSATRLRTAKVTRPLNGKASRNLIEETADAAAEVIKEAGAPVPRGKLYEALVARGMKFGGKDPKNALGTRLYHSGRFRTIEGQGYVLKPD